MNIIWHGHSCFTIEEKTKNGLVTLVIDPYRKEIGLRESKWKADVVTSSHNHIGHNNVEAVAGMEKNPIVFDRPGEYESKGIFAMGIGAYHDKKDGANLGKTTMFRFDIEGISILHLGDLAMPLSDAQLEKIDDIDVLLIPVGGENTLNAAEAAEVVRQIEPRVVIPMHYAIPGEEKKLDGVEKFKKEMGEGAEVMSKFKITKKELPEDTTKVVILEKV